MHANLAGESRGEITLQQRCTQPTRIVGRELRLECTRCREQQPMLPQLPLYQQSVSTVFHSKPRCHANMEHWTHQHALLVQKDFLSLFHPKPNGCLHFDLESCHLMHILLLPTHVTFPPLAQAHPTMLCIYTSSKH